MLSILRAALALAAQLDGQYRIGLVASEAGFQLTVDVEHKLLEEARA